MRITTVEEDLEQTGFGSNYVIELDGDRTPFEFNSHAVKMLGELHGKASVFDIVDMLMKEHAPFYELDDDESDIARAAITERVAKISKTDAPD